MLLELMDHSKACFVTLTFKDDPGKLEKDQWQSFAKRLRYYAGPFRFYAVGELGGKNGRPHYHAGLFGIGMEERELVAKAWRGHLAGDVKRVPVDSFGGVHVGELNHDSAQYVLKYMCKPFEEKLVFMSRRPGIGAGWVSSVAESLLEDGPLASVVSAGDVPREVRLERKKYPVGRFLRGKLRMALGQSVRCPGEVVRARALERSLDKAEDVLLRQKKREVAAVNAEARFRRKSMSEVL